jgi:hypothetical protein
LLGTRRRLWKGREQLDPGGAVADSFQIGRAVAGLLARPLPVDHRLLGAIRHRVVLGHQLRLGLHERGEPSLYDLGYFLVHLLSGALEQRRIGGVLNQGVLKQIPAPRWPSPLVEEFGLHPSIPHRLSLSCGGHSCPVSIAKSYYTISIMAMH